MKARLPKEYTMSMNDRLKQLQKMQEDMENAKQKVEEEEFTASSGGGAVEVTANGKKELVKISLKPEIVDPDDIEMLEDVILAAANEALRKAEEAMDEAISKNSQGFNIPGMPGLM